MLELRKRYIELKAKARELMLKGETNSYIKLLTEIEQMNLILVRVK